MDKLFTVKPSSRVFTGSKSVINGSNRSNQVLGNVVICGEQVNGLFVYSVVIYVSRDTLATKRLGAANGSLGLGTDDATCPI